MSPLTPIQAQAQQDDADSSGAWLVWFVMTDPEHGFVARAHTLDNSGGVWLPGALIADTIEELRRMLPRRLRRRSRTSVMGPDVLETWD